MLEYRILGDITYVSVRLPVETLHSVQSSLLENMTKIHLRFHNAAFVLP